MSKQTINIGASPNDGTGTPLRTSFDYCNQNFTELYTATGPSGNNIVVPGNATITGDLTVDTSTLKVDSTNNRVGIVQATPLYPLHLVGEFGLQEESAGNGSKLRFIGDASKYNFRLGKQINFTNTFEITPSTAIGGTTFSYPVYTVTYDGTHTFLDGAGGTRMTLNSTGLGIGAVPSAYKLHVAGTGYFSSILTLGGASRISAEGSNALNLNTNSADRLTIDSSGNVGVGVTPSAWQSGLKAIQFAANGVLYANGTNGSFFGTNFFTDSTGANKYLLSSYLANAYGQVNGAHIWYNAPAGTAGASAAVTSGQLYTVSVLGSSTLAQWQAFFSALTVLPTVGQVVTATATGSIVGGGTVSQNITFTQAMTLDASGNLMVGQAAVTGANIDSFVYNKSGSYVSVSHVNGTGSGTAYLQFLYNNTSVGTITQNGTTGVLYNITSDYRLKESVKPILGGLARVNALKPSVYNWKSDGSAGEGFIAHELAEVVPFAVSGEKDAVNADGTIKSQGIDMSRVVPILVAAIQELTARVQILEAR